MKTSVMMLSVLFTIMLSACMGNISQESTNKNDNKLELPNDSVVAIDEMGDTSNGSKFEVYSDSTFSLDGIYYIIVDSHLEVFGADPKEISGTTLKIYAGIIYDNVYCETKIIREHAFWFCPKEQILIPNTVNYIGHGAFECSKIKEIVIPPNVTFIGIGCFNGCSYLKSVELSNGIKYIGPEAFKDCSSLTNLFIPKSVEQIWYSAFATSTNTIIYLDGRPEGIFLEDLGGGMNRIYPMGDYDNQTLVVPDKKNYLWVKSTEPWCNYKNIEIW